MCIIDLVHRINIYSTATSKKTQFELFKPNNGSMTFFPEKKKIMKMEIVAL